MSARDFAAVDHRCVPGHRFATTHRRPERRIPIAKRINDGASVAACSRVGAYPGSGCGSHGRRRTSRPCWCGTESSGAVDQARCTNGGGRFRGLDDDRPPKIALQEVLGSCEAHGIVLRVLDARDAQPHVCRCLVNADAAWHGRATPAQAACEAQDSSQAANTIPLFGRELRELFVPGCWLRTPVVANHLCEEIHRVPMSCETVRRLLVQSPSREADQRAIRAADRRDRSCG